MGAYQIGRDIQELKSRIERIEAVLPAGGGPRGGRQAATVQASVHRGKHPVLWKHETATPFPAFAHGLLGPAPDVKIETAESKTWHGFPDPTIFFVSWDDGSSDEYFRLVGPSFSLIRFMTAFGPQTTATYAAKLVASGKAHSAFRGESIDLSMTNDAGDNVFGFTSSFDVYCDDNRYLILQADVPLLALYDIVTGANWSFRGGSVYRCPARFGSRGETHRDPQS